MGGLLFWFWMRALNSNLFRKMGTFGAFGISFLLWILYLPYLVQLIIFNFRECLQFFLLLTVTQVKIVLSFDQIENLLGSSLSKIVIFCLQNNLGRLKFKKFQFICLSKLFKTRFLTVIKWLNELKALGIF